MRIAFATFSLATVIVSLLLLCSPVAAQVIVDHQYLGNVGELTLTPVLSFSEIEYEADGGGEVDIDRTILGVSLGYGAHQAFDVFADVAYFPEAEIEGGRGDGDGFMLGGGLKANVYQHNKLSLRAYGGLHFLNEDYGSATDGSLFEMYLGGTARGQLLPEFGVYGGLDIVPISDGEIEGSGGQDFDIDRDNLVGLRFGADYNLQNKFRFTAEFSVVSEKAFTIRCTFPLG